MTGAGFSVNRSTIALLMLTGVCAASASADAQQPQPSAATRIVAAANVNLRAQPSASSQAVAQLALGTEVTETGPAGANKTWVRIRLADGREGWVLASLTRPIDGHWRWITYDRIIEERLGRTGDGFAAIAELVAFIERVAPAYTDADGRARIDLSRLRAMAAALKALPVAAQNADPYRRWMDARKDELVYNEPAGEWMLRSPVIWALQARHARTALADDLAWFAVSNGLAGECEGWVPCYMASKNVLEGEYLRRLPRGRRAEEAVAVIRDMTDMVVKPDPSNAPFTFDPKADCADLTKLIDALSAAITATRAPSRDAALASLATLRKRCG